MAALAAACGRPPSDEQALAAIRLAYPAQDSSRVVARVWQDGPAWFSCAEVLAKLGSPVDAAAVRDPLANWRGMLLSGWGVVRDSTYGPVSDPGWCVVKLLPDSLRGAERWVSADGPPFATGYLRRGWLVEVGRSRIVIRESARSAQSGDAEVDYAVSLAPNASGRALHGPRATPVYRARLRRQDGRWRVVAAQPLGAASR